MLFVIRHSSFVIRHSSFVIRHSSFVIRHWLASPASPASPASFNQACSLVKIRTSKRIFGNSSDIDIAEVLCRKTSWLQTLMSNSL
ncbi:hypothetical protein [Coleofasciculus sp. F4-SAH-05]|uniref:hypothetical protein n=1 Tax=Coleofasciculus sp. F4-SAH-05 TaxID=3069525 RepID=UPI004062C0A7